MGARPATAKLPDAVRGFVERYPARWPAWRCVLASVYAELDRRRDDARRELEALARNSFADLPRDWLWLGSIAILSEVVAFLDDARRSELLYELLLPFADRHPATEGLNSAARLAKPRVARRRPLP